MKEVGTLLLAFILCFFSITSNSYGQSIVYKQNSTQATNKWADHSDDLPNDGTSPLIYIALGAIAIGVIYYFVTRDDETETTENNITVDEDTKESASLDRNISIVSNAQKNISELENNLNKPSSLSEKIPFKVNFNMVKLKCQADQFTYQVGFAINL